ncbi:MAG: hypothetical protein A2Y61_05075 [Chloroflexi bacterium RBG_13_60_13]|nr:MAG: hypothetical protein A2Y61_05075 [Chloroflexi bacterium RBG_13_60_13]
MTVQVLEEIPVTVDKREILRLQGRHGKERLGRPIRKILEEVFEDCHSLLHPRAVCVQMEARVLRKTIRLANGLSLRNPDGARVWHNADRLVAVVCTIGPALERRVSELSAQGASTAALMLDGIGSVAVESVADRVNRRICRDAARHGMSVGPRLSPGYGTWPLEDQTVIFTIVPAQRIGVHLNEQGMMIPMKSVSFCVGLGRDLPAHEGTDPCQYCNLKSCRYRRQPKASR